MQKPVTSEKLRLWDSAVPIVGRMFFVIPSAVEEPRDAALKVPLRDPSTPLRCAQDDEVVLCRQPQKRFATWSAAIRQSQRPTVRFRNLPAQR